LQFPYTQVAGLLKEQGTSITVAKFDATGDDMDTKMLKSLYAVKSFPGIFLFNDGAHIKMNPALGHAMDETGIIGFVNAYVEPRWKEITTEEEMQAVEQHDPLACVGFFFPDFNSPHAGAVKTAALRVHEGGAKFYLTRNKDLMTARGLTEASLMFISQEHGGFQAKKMQAEITTDASVILDTAHHFALPPVLALNAEEAVFIGISANVPVSSSL
jgi:hypothetical protein